MPTKKTTTKKTTTKKPVTKKTTTKKPVAKKTIKTVTKATPKTSVVVKEINKTNNCVSCPKGRAVIASIFAILLIINTILLALLFFNNPNQTAFYDALESFEATKVGGETNYNVVKEIYKLPAYQEDQMRRLEATLGTLKQMEADGTTLPILTN